MHIKQLTLSGFRSFRSQSEIEPFSSKHNVIVGRNGSGKSNFFDAIQFVLVSSRFNTLRQEERQHLLHEGAGANVMAAYVEIIFDNSDARMTVDGDEVVLRRTIGLKKDEFFLNRKRVTKSEVSSLLESAGFSKSNPYYIVQQGKVNALCLMKDQERLQLLKEVGGTRVYEERREESLKIISETTSKREKIQEVISYIEKRLEELEGEKEELKAYQQLDRDRRALEYTIYDKELRKAREQVERLEAERALEADRIHELHDENRKTQDDLAKQKHVMSEAESDLRKLEADQSEAEAERAQCIQTRAKLELDVKDMEERVEADHESQENAERELQALEKQIKEATAELGSRVEPEYELCKKARGTTDAKKAEVDLQINELHAKQGRGTQYSTIEERDTFLQEQLHALEDSIQQNEEAIKKTEKREKMLTAQQRETAEEICEHERDMQQRQAMQAELGKDIAAKEAERNELHETRKMKWRAREEITDKVDHWKQNLDTHEQDFRSSMPKHIAQGLKAVERIVERENISGYFGPVMHNFTLRHEKYRLPVEVAAGNQLFHVIVDNDDTAARLIKCLNREKAGRLTFMPLSKLVVYPVDYPKSKDVHPLIELAIEFKPELKKAMQQIFNKKLLARDFETATKFSNECNMDSITFDGDQVNRKGALEGGYHDDRKSKLLAFYGIRKAKEELIKHEAEHETCEAEATAVDQQIAHLMGTIQKSEAKRNNLHEVAKQVIEEVTLRKKELSKLEDQINSVIEKQPSMLRELTQLQAQAQSFRTEIGTPLKTTLTKEEHSTLKRLTALSQRYSEELAARDAALEDVAVERKRLQSLLKDNLSKRANEARERLSSALGDIGADAAQRQEILANRRLELDRQDRGTKSVAASLKEIRKAYQERRSIVNDCQSDIEVLRANEAEIQERLEHVEKTSEKQLNKRSMLVQKREENLRKIQELGSLPTAELDTHSHLNIKDLMKKLHSTNQKLTKYSHVNKKALDQYVNFSEQREQLLERKKELDDGSAAIRDLISSLDQQKDEAILRTFKGVSKHFSEVFSELVPSGSGHLIMRTSTDLEEDDEEEGDGSGGTPRMTVSDFEGVQVKVSFTPGGEVFLMSQLSGGQKAIVALSIVFAIQRCDPAPFYLFDELDQALDSTYRAAVAAMIQRQASHPTNPTQFITTTFRPELVNVAAKCYGISLQNKNSNIHPLSKGEALSFVADLMNEEEGVGTVSATPKTRGVAEEDSDSDDDDEAENSASRNQTAAHRKRKR